MPMRLSFGSPEANTIAKRDRDYKLSNEYLENLPDPTDAEMELMQQWEELVEAQDEYNYAESALMRSKEKLIKTKKAVLEERQHETRTS